MGNPGRFPRFSALFDVISAAAKNLCMNDKKDNQCIGTCVRSHALRCQVCRGLGLATCATRGQPAAAGQGVSKFV
jgi:hypothetical protein